MAAAVHSDSWGLDRPYERSSNAYLALTARRSFSSIFSLASRCSSSAAASAGGFLVAHSDCSHGGSASRDAAAPVLASTRIANASPRNRCCRSSRSHGRMPCRSARKIICGPAAASERRAFRKSAQLCATSCSLSQRTCKALRPVQLSNRNAAPSPGPPDNAWSADSRSWTASLVTSCCAHSHCKRVLSRRCSHQLPIRSGSRVISGRSLISCIRRAVVSPPWSTRSSSGVAPCKSRAEIASGMRLASSSTELSSRLSSSARHTFAHSTCSAVRRVCGSRAWAASVSSFKNSSIRLNEALGLRSSVMNGCVAIAGSGPKFTCYVVQRQGNTGSPYQRAAPSSGPQQRSQRAFTAA